MAKVYASPSYLQSKAIANLSVDCKMKLNT